MCAAHVCLQRLEKSEVASGRRQGLVRDLFGREGVVRGRQGRVSGPRTNMS